MKMFQVSVPMLLIKEGKFAHTRRGWPSTSVERAFIPKRKRGPTAPIPNTSIRTNCYDHLPIFTKKGQCQKPNYKGFTFAACSKCSIQLFSRISWVMSEWFCQSIPQLFIQYCFVHMLKIICFLILWCSFCWHNMITCWNQIILVMDHYL